MSQPSKCPICRKALASDAARESEHFPFCSERCRNIDLVRWSEGKYAIVEPLTELSDNLAQDGDDHEPKLRDESCDVGS
ncbi:MAG: DNA gyrase inhibitor YacG [Planctomycetaceae bacterium]